MDADRALHDLMVATVERRIGRPVHADEVEIGPWSDANRGRGVFSRVVRVTVAAPGIDRWTVVVKAPIDGANGAAARASGAYRREALAYRALLPPSPVRVPEVHLIREHEAGGATLVLEDLAGRRWVDQLDGAGPDDTVAVAAALARFHRHWATEPGLDRLEVRRSVPALLSPTALADGLDALDRRWEGDLGPDARAAFARLVASREAAVDAFEAAGRPTLCHGDPRVDNMAFDPDGVPVLFDWQQLAVQPPGADIAWLAATSVRPEDRRILDHRLAEAAGIPVDAYRAGMVLPGLAVLLLAQRETPDERSRRFVATSLIRIGTALVDLEPPA